MTSIGKRLHKATGKNAKHRRGLVNFEVKQRHNFWHRYFIPSTPAVSCTESSTSAKDLQDIIKTVVVENLHKLKHLSTSWISCLSLPSRWDIDVGLRRDAEFYKRLDQLKLRLEELCSNNFGTNATLTFEGPEEGSIAVDSKIQLSKAADWDQDCFGKFCQQALDDKLIAMYTLIYKTPDSP